MEREVWHGKGLPAARPAGTGVAGGDGGDSPTGEVRPWSCWNAFALSGVMGFVS